MLSLCLLALATNLPTAPPLPDATEEIDTIVFGSCNREDQPQDF